MTAWSRQHDRPVSHLLGCARWRCWTSPPGRSPTTSATPTAAPLILLGSGAHDRHDFDGLRDLLPDRFRTIAPDWPAHGESPAGRGPGERDALRGPRRGAGRAPRAERRGRRRQLGRRLRRWAARDPAPGAGQGPGARRQRRLRRPATPGAGLLRADVAARLPAPRLPTLRPVVHAAGGRSRPAGPRRRRGDDARGPWAGRGRRALGQLRLPRARPARRGRLDRGSDAPRLGAGATR